MDRMVKRLEPDQRLDLEVPNPSWDGTTKLGGQVYTLPYGPNAGKTGIQLYRRTGDNDWNLIWVPLEDIPIFNALVGHLILHLVTHDLLSWDSLLKNFTRPRPAIDDSPGNGGDY